MSVEVHHVLDGPADGPAVVLSNSVGSNLHMWEPQVKPLVDNGYRVIRYDSRGHGESPVPTGPYGVEDLGGDVLALLDRLGVESAHFVGLSIGGMTGIWLGVQAPERIRSLVLCCTSAQPGNTQMWLDRVNQVRTEGMAGIAEGSLHRWFTQDWIDANPEQAGERAAHHVQSLDRGLAVIRAFSSGASELTLSDVARTTGLTRAAARRFLLTLVDLGYVRTDGKYFSLTARVLELGYAYLSSMSLPEIAQPHLERLSAEVHESCSMSVLDGTDIVYVGRVAVSRIMTVSINLGTRLPAYATSMGHVLLAGLSAAEFEAFLAVTEIQKLTAHTLSSEAELRAEIERVREQGWALVDQELEEGVRSVAAPIRDRAGAVVAAVNVATHAGRTTTETVCRELVPPLLAAAKRIEADLALAPARARRA